MAWATLATSGLLSGTAPGAQEYDTVTVQVQDALGNTTQRAFALSVLLIPFWATDSGAPVVDDSGNVVIL